MSDHKFLKDGRKVVVLGKLNATESIVQEIYCREDGSEIPQGEQFVEKNLLDEPLQTYKEKQCAVIDKRLKKMQAEADALQQSVRKAQARAKAKAQALSALVSNAAAEQLKTLEMFVAGEITHVVRVNSLGCTIKPFDEEIEKLEDGWSGWKLRLLSLFGRTDGSLAWCLNTYSDHSGSSWTVIPARSKAEALEIAQREFDRHVGIWRERREENKNACPPKPGWLRHSDKLVVPADVTFYWRDRAKTERAAQIKRVQDELDKLKAAGSDR